MLPSRLLSFQSVIVKSIEKNAASLYAARERLLGQAQGPLAPPAGGLEGNASASATSYLGLSSNLSEC